MSRRDRRYAHAPPDLTSLLDVLFILIFAALIRTAAVQQAAAKPHTPMPVVPLPAIKLEAVQLQQRALSDLGKQLASRPFVIARISAAGAITELELGDQVAKLTTPLLEHSPDPDIGLAYLGDRADELRICRVIAVQLALPDLSKHLVILAPDKHLADLPHALYEGLRRDIDRCLRDQQALAVLVDPTLEEPKKAVTP
jgi:hypothetical protein